MVNMIKGTIQEIAFNLAEADLAEAVNNSDSNWSFERTIFVLGSNEVVCIVLYIYIYLNNRDSVINRLNKLSPYRVKLHLSITSLVETTNSRVPR